MRRKGPAGSRSADRRIIVDAYGDDEQLWAFRQAFEEEVSVPCDAFVVGERVSITAFDYDGNNARRGLTAVCRREDGSKYVVPAADVVLPAQSVGGRHLAAYYRWLGKARWSPAHGERFVPILRAPRSSGESPVGARRDRQEPTICDALVQPPPSEGGRPWLVEAALVAVNTLLPSTASLALREVHRSSMLLAMNSAAGRTFPRDWRNRRAAWVWLLVLVLPRASRGLAWTQNATPRGGIITALALSGSSPSILYAGTVSAGIVVSSDGGTTWIPRLDGLPTGTVDFLAGDPLRAERAVASVNVGGEDFVFHTEDGGASWSGIPGIQSPDFVVNTLVIDPVHPALVYAATFVGLFVWQEGSSEWKPVGFANSDVASLAIDPRSGAFYASVEDPDTGVFHIWKSEKGRGWSVLPLFVPCECGGQLVTDPARSNTLYLAGLPPNALLKSGDGGRSWTSITAPPLYLNGALFAAPDGVLYSAGWGVVRSADGGRSWLPPLTSTTSGAPPYDAVSMLVVSPANVKTLYLASDEGVWKTTNGGETWERSSNGIAAQPVYSLAVANDAESTVYASLESGLFRSRDGGKTWRRTNLLGALRPHFLLGVAPSDPQRLYGDGLRSDDGGKTWRQVYFIGFDCYALDAQAVDPQDENVLYLGGYDCYGDFHDAQAFLVRTDDGGTTWTDITGSFSDGTNFEPAALAIDPQHPRTLYALAHGSLAQTAGNGFFKSLDAGATWDQVGSGLPLQWPDYYPTTFALAVDADHPEVVYVGLPGLGVWMSSDGGASFSAMNCGLPTGLVGSILVTPASNEPLYAGLPGLGVWAWNAGTQCWTPLNSGLPAGDFTGAIVFSAHGEGVLDAGTGGNGLWRLDLP